MTRKVYFLAALLFGGCALSAWPATLRSVDVTRDRGRYQVVADTHLDAPPSAIYRVLVDFADDGYSRISEIYKESGYLPPDGDGTPLVFTRVEGCLLFFCRSMLRVERLEVVKPNFIRATVLPERSDFKYSRAEWSIEPEGDGTRLVYRMEMEPNFWLPPFVGPWFLRRTLLRGAPLAVERIEELAQAPDGSRVANAAAR
jgi:Polyketide cyclase / dehydrase and lipid transport